jgi:hypothetical protein
VLPALHCGLITQGVYGFLPDSAEGSINISAKINKIPNMPLLFIYL